MASKFSNEHSQRFHSEKDGNKSTVWLMAKLFCVINVASATFALFIENEASMGIEIFERDFKWNFIKS